MSLPRRTVLRATSVLALVSLLTALGVRPAPAAKRSRHPAWVTVSRRAIAPGLVYTHLRGPGPVQVFELSLDLRQRISFDVGLARRNPDGLERTSAMARRYGALAAVNGDFRMGTDHPAHPFMEDGFLRYAARKLHGGQDFAVSQDERHLFMGPPRVGIMATFPSTGVGFKVNLWNDGKPRADEVGGYTKLDTAEIPAMACSALLAPAGGLRWSGSHAALQRDFSLSDFSCGGPAPSPGSGVVLSMHRFTPLADSVRLLPAGTKVRLRWSLGLMDVADAIGGNPRLLKNGASVVRRGTGHLYEHNPRTGVGFTPKGRLLMVVVDGRSERSVGMTLQGFAGLFSRLGATQALNLDGGGSSTMVVRGKVVNRPSDSSGERRVNSALLVLPGRDAGERILPPA